MLALVRLQRMLCNYVSCHSVAPSPNCERYVVKLVGAVPNISNKFLLTIQVSVYSQLNLLKWSM